MKKMLVGGLIILSTSTMSYASDDLDEFRGGLQFNTTLMFCMQGLAFVQAAGEESVKQVMVPTTNGVGQIPATCNENKITNLPTVAR